MSPDAKEWAAIGNANGIKKLFHMSDMKYDLDVNMTQKGGTEAFLTFEGVPEESK